MFGRRLLVLVLVLMGLTALAASLTPPPQTLRRTTPSGPAATASPTPAPAPAQSRTISAHLSADGGRVRHVSAQIGDLVDLDVTGDVVDTVVSDDLAISAAIAPSSPAQIQLYADTPGSYPIELLDAGRRIGVLRITRPS